MSSHMLDMRCYARKAHFDCFRSLPYSYVGVTVDQDVTEAFRFSEETGRSFYLTEEIEMVLSIA